MKSARRRGGEEKSPRSAWRREEERRPSVIERKRNGGGNNRGFGREEGGGNGCGIERVEGRRRKRKGRRDRQDRDSGEDEVEQGAEEEEEGKAKRKEKRERNGNRSYPRGCCRCCSFGRKRRASWSSSRDLLPATRPIQDRTPGLRRSLMSATSPALTPATSPSPERSRARGTLLPLRPTATNGIGSLLSLLLIARRLPPAVRRLDPNRSKLPERPSFSYATFLRKPSFLGISTVPLLLYRRSARPPL